MGIGCGDSVGRRRPAGLWRVTNFYGESTTFFQNLGKGSLSPTGRSRLEPRGARRRHVLGFGAFFLDADDNGRLDLVQANGHVNDFRPGTPYAMPTQLFLGTAGGRFADASDRAGDCWNVLRVGRGLAVGDVDNDGRQDVVILAQASPLAFFHNQGGGEPARAVRSRSQAGRSAVEPGCRRCQGGRHGLGPHPDRLAARRRQLPLGV